MIMRSKTYQALTISQLQTMALSEELSPVATPIKSPIKLKQPISSDVSIIAFDKTHLTVSNLDKYVSLIDQSHYLVDRITLEEADLVRVSPFKDSFFDMRENTKSITLEDDILMFINEYVEASRNGSTTRLTILPINYVEYSRLMSKLYKRPLKNQAWRLLDNSDGHKKAEIVIGPNDTITKYVIRYVKRPRAIRLTTFDDVTLDGGNTAQCCELDPILFPEIIQRACELAKAAYTGDLQSQLALGQTSQTNMGIITQSR